MNKLKSLFFEIFIPTLRKNTLFFYGNNTGTTNSGLTLLPTGLIQMRKC